MGYRYPPIPRGSRPASDHPFRGPDPFSLADPPAVTEILNAAGFADVAFTDVHEPVYYGPDVAAALDWVRGFACTSELLSRLDPAAAARTAGRLRETLAAHLSEDGVRFDSRAWIVTARRRWEADTAPLGPTTPVIHLSTPTFVHKRTAVEQHVCVYHPQACAQTATLAGPRGWCDRSKLSC
jgi:hypothetical protein